MTKIHEYANIRTAGSISLDDLFDIDATNDGGTTWFSAKLQAGELITLLQASFPDTLYSGNGTLSASRLVTMNSNDIIWREGTHIVEQVGASEEGYQVWDNATNVKAILGYNNSSNAGEVMLYDSLDAIHFVARDGYTGLGFDSTLSTPNAERLGIDGGIYMRGEILIESQDDTENWGINIRDAGGSNVAGMFYNDATNGGSIYLRQFGAGNNWFVAVDEYVLIGAPVQSIAGEKLNVAGKVSMRELVFEQSGVFYTILSDGGNRNNILIGENAGAAVTGTAPSINNIAIGQNALQNNTTQLNIAIGNNALRNSTTSQRNLAIGASALLATTTGQFNIGVGWSALTNLITANDNVAIGVQAGQGLEGGSGNTFIGRAAGVDTSITGHENFTHSIALGKSAKTQGSNQMVVGNISARIDAWHFGAPEMDAGTYSGFAAIRVPNIKDGLFTEASAPYDLNLYGGAGTGTQDGTNINFRVAPGSAVLGQNQNGFDIVMQIEGSGNVAIPQGTSGLYVAGSSLLQTGDETLHVNGRGYFQGCIFSNEDATGGPSSGLVMDDGNKTGQIKAGNVILLTSDVLDAGATYVEMPSLGVEQVQFTSSNATSIWHGHGKSEDISYGTEATSGGPTPNYSRTIQTSWWNGSAAVFTDFLIEVNNLLPGGEQRVQYILDGTTVMQMFSDGRIAMNNLPTSSAGLPANTLWNDSGTLKIT